MRDETRFCSSNVSTDTLARLSVYTVPSSNPSYTALLPHFLHPRTALPHSLVMIVLDWTRPWSFVEELQTWLLWVERWVRGDGSRELEMVREECRERCKCKRGAVLIPRKIDEATVQSYIQHYSEPSTDPLPASTSALNNTILPLGSGTLTHNTAGVPIIVVCSKADLIDEENDTVAGAAGMGGMVKGKGGEWEERTDGIMQVLRTICLKCEPLCFTLLIVNDIIFLQMAHRYSIRLLNPPPSKSYVNILCTYSSYHRLLRLQWVEQMPQPQPEIPFLSSISRTHLIATALSCLLDGTVGVKFLF